MKSNTVILNSLLDMMKIEEEITALLDNMKEAEFAFEMHSAICDCITKCGGVTTSLESMFGENFSSAASMEAESQEEKKGIIGTIVQWVKDFFAKIWAWFKSWFQTRDDMIKELSELKAKADRLKYPIVVPNYFHALLKSGLGTALMNFLAELGNFSDEFHRDMTTMLANLTDEERAQANAYLNGKERSSITDATANVAEKLQSGSWNRFVSKWEYFKAHISFDAIKYANGNEEIPNPGVLKSNIDALIAELNLSKKISENYKQIGEAWEAYLTAKDAILPGLRAKEFVIYAWKENQKYFHALLRLGNLILQRAEEDPNPKASAPSAPSTPPPAAPAGQPTAAPAQQPSAEPKKSLIQKIKEGIKEKGSSAKSWIKQKFHKDFEEISFESLSSEEIASIEEYLKN